jgi:hypothetical protein
MPVLEDPKSALTRTKDLYVTTAIIWLSTSILTFFLIGASYVYAWIRPPLARRSYIANGRAAALGTLSHADAIQCFKDFENLQNSQAYRYRPWVGFSERVFKSRFLNIDYAEPLPTRRTIDPRDGEPATKTIWLFGGSTQFGQLVPDGQTIASHLSAILSTGRTHYKVVNLGHTWYYSSQEAALFETLLRHGQKADLAVFLDGLNDLSFSSGDVPWSADRTATGYLKEERFAAAANSGQITIGPYFPPVRILNRLLGRRPSNSDPEADGRARVDYDPLRIYRFNMLAIQKIAEAENIGVAFYWQPTPFDDLPEAEQNRKVYKVSDIYSRLNLSIRQTIRHPDFHFLADLFQHEAYKDVYVDDVHYGDKGCSMVAQAIAESLRKEGRLP